MKTLNPDILEEILPHFSSSGEVQEIEKNVVALKKFMSSGKEPFYAALRYFSRTTKVCVSTSDIVVHVNSFPLLKKDGDPNRHYIPYDFEYLDGILNAFSETLLYVEDYPESIEGRRAVAILIQFKKFKSLHTQIHDLPPEYISFFKTECVFDRLELMDDGRDNPSLLDILEMDAKIYKFFSVLPFFIQQCHKLPHLQKFPSVKNLELECIQLSDNFIFSTNRIKQLLLIFPERFPNLQTLTVECVDEANLGETYEEMLKMQPQEFHNCVSPQLKGSVNIVVENYPEDEAFHNFVSGIEDTPYIKIINNGEEIGIVSEFEIHNGLTFKFKINVGR